MGKLLSCMLPCLFRDTVYNDDQTISYIKQQPLIENVFGNDSDYSEFSNLEFHAPIKYYMMASRRHYTI